MEVMSFLNTDRVTTMGPGVNLEVGNSIYFDMPPDQFAYWNTDDIGRDMVRTLIHSGHIDCLHSYGDLAVTRRHATRALEELNRHDCRLAVWIDHSRAPTNFGADIMCGSGDVPGSPTYHADLACEFGIRYVWRGRITSTIGQDVPARVGDVFTHRHALASAKTVVKEVAKRWLSRAGNDKYAMHSPNRVLRNSCLRDGRPVMEFMRCNPHWRGVGEGANADGVPEALTEPFLERLVQRRGACVFYTHLGKVSNPRMPFNASTRAAFRRLADKYQDGEILVTTTWRLLRYLTMREHIQYHAEIAAGRLRITIQSVNDPAHGPRQPSVSDLDGITFHTPNTEEVNVQLVDGTTVACHTVRAGSQSMVTIPWRPLSFPNF